MSERGRYLNWYANGCRACWRQEDYSAYAVREADRHSCFAKVTIMYYNFQRVGSGIMAANAVSKRLLFWTATSHS